MAITRFGVVQIFGFIVAVMTFVLFLLILILEVPYEPESSWINIFAFLLPLYAASANWSPNQSKITKGLSIACIFIGVILGFTLFIFTFFIESEWGTVIISVGLELIGASAAGLGIGATT